MQTEDQKCNSAPAEPFEERLDIDAVGVDSPRNKGDIVEAKFLAKASSLGFGVARPWAVERYDFVLDSGYRFWRVQVKSNRGRPTGGYMVKVSGYKRVAYTEKDIDFLVAYLVPENLWYIVPVTMLKGRDHLCFFPHGRGTSPWEKYREAWCQMACPRDEISPTRLLVERQRDYPFDTCKLCNQKCPPKETRVKLNRDPRGRWQKFFMPLEAGKDLRGLQRRRNT